MEKGYELYDSNSVVFGKEKIMDTVKRSVGPRGWKRSDEQVETRLLGD